MPSKKRKSNPEIASSDTEEDEETLVECHGVGDPIYFDTVTNRKFFAAYTVGDLKVSFGDCVRVRFKGNDQTCDRADIFEDGDEDNGFGQVLAIFEDELEEMFIEVIIRSL